MDEREDTDDSILVRLPRMTRLTKTLAVVSGVVWLLEVLLQGVGGPHGPLGPFERLALVPAAVLHGEVWRLLTYALLHDPVSATGVLFTVLSLWLLGAPMERAWGARRMALVAAGATLVGAVAVVGVGFADSTVFTRTTVGPAAFDAALLAAWCLAQGRQPVSFFGLVSMRGRDLLAVSVVITLVGLLLQRSGSSVAALAGVAVGAGVHRLGARREQANTPSSRRGGSKFRVIQGGGGDLPN